MSERNLYIPALGGIYSSLDGVALLALRLAVGLSLVPHGAQKLFGMFGGYGISGTAQFLDSVGYSPGVLFATLIGVVEFFGGLAIAIGLFTRPAALAAMIFLLTAVTFHMGNGFFWTEAGFEYPLMWAVGCFYFFIRGAGPLSVDAKMGKEF